MLTRVTDDVLVHQSELLANNTVVVEGRGGVLLVDPGLTNAEMTCLAKDLRVLGRPVVAGFATHPDWDHSLWHADLGDAPRFGTARCAAFLEDLLSQPDWRDRVAEGLPPEIADDTPLDDFGLVTALPDGATHVPWDGPAVRVIEHPAHAPGHAALLVEGSGVLVAGDMLSDVFVPMLDDWRGDNDPLEDHLTGLRLLEDAAADVDFVVPGHGSVGGAGRARARIDLDRAYVKALRDDREPDDPRITSAEPGWEWVSAIHEGQAATVAQHRGDVVSTGSTTREAGSTTRQATREDL
jgi:glyoxylase-like metal-dependent hydrolase (beta-lactamase superfamily II)